jgi:hypothetical protein
MKKDDVRVEVSGGYLLIAIKIQSCSCAACGKIYTENVRPERVAAAIFSYQPISLDPTPWCGAAGWNFVQLGETDGFKRALVCDECFAPVKALEDAAEDLKRQAHAKVGATVKTWLP